MIKVSIVVPVYNKEREIKRCLDSLVNQTLKEIEIIVINDGSSDNSLEIIKSYVTKYGEKIKCIDQDNQGIGKARNNGLQNAVGDYIGFVDGDDYVDLDMYEEYYNFAKINNLDIVNSFYKKIFPNEVIEFGRMKHPITNIGSYLNLINEVEYGPCSKIFLRKLIEDNEIRFEENLKYEDMPFVLKAYYHAGSIGYLDKALYNYCINDNSETTIIDERVLDIFYIMDIVNNYYNKYKGTKEIEYLNIKQITKYMLQQKHHKNTRLKNKFINKGYDILDNGYPNWRSNSYYKKEQLSKRWIKNRKILLRIYCSLGR